MTQIVKLDKIDFKILNVLQLDSRISNQKLSERVALSPSASLARLRRLEETGIIKRYLAEIDIDLIMPSVVVFAEVTLENHFPQDFTKFDRATAKIAEIIESYQVSGPYDYLLKIVTPNINEYRVLADKMLALDIGIAKMISNIVMKTAKAFAGYELIRERG